MFCKQKTIYVCSVCGKEFESEAACEEHEDKCKRLRRESDEKSGAEPVFNIDIRLDCGDFYDVNDDAKEEATFLPDVQVSLVNKATPVCDIKRELNADPWFDEDFEIVMAGGAWISREDVPAYVGIVKKMLKERIDERYNFEQKAHEAWLARLDKLDDIVGNAIESEEQDFFTE